MCYAVIFDLDGTLLNTLDDIRDVVNTVFHSNGIPGRSVDEIRAAVGRGVEALVRNLLPSGSVTHDDVLEVAEQIRKTFLAHDSIRTRPYPGIKELLNNLQKKQIPIAVLTNKPQGSAEKAIEMHFSDISFISVDGVRAGLRMKPSIEAAAPVLEKLGSIPARTLMVGDSDVDMNTAANAGMIAVGVSWGFRDVSLLLDHGADHIVDHPAEILEIIMDRT